jgi:hypothetical protein
MYVEVSEDEALTIALTEVGISDGEFEKLLHDCAPVISNFETRRPIIGSLEDLD